MAALRIHVTKSMPRCWNLIFKRNIHPALCERLKHCKNHQRTSAHSRKLRKSCSFATSAPHPTLIMPTDRTWKVTGTWDKIKGCYCPIIPGLREEFIHKWSWRETGMLIAQTFRGKLVMCKVLSRCRGGARLYRLQLVPNKIRKDAKPEAQGTVLPPLKWTRLW